MTKNITLDAIRMFENQFVTECNREKADMVSSVVLWAIFGGPTKCQENVTCEDLSGFSLNVVKSPIELWPYLLNDSKHTHYYR